MKLIFNTTNEKYKVLINLTKDGFKFIYMPKVIKKLKCMVVKR